MQSQQQSLIYLHIAVLLFGGTALFAKLIGLNALDITAYRAAIAGLAICVLLTLQKKPIKLHRAKDYVIAILLGVAVGIPKTKDIISAVVVIFGIYLLIPNVNLGDDITLGVVTGVVSALFFALRNITHKRYFSEYGGPQTMFYQTLVASLMLCAFIEVPITEINDTDLILLLIAGVVFTAMPHSLFAASLKHLSAATAGLISCLQPLYGTILAIIILHERPSVMTLIGGALIVSAACFETWSISRKKQP